jgi:bifunctional non-homologous end joining protein LigD
VLYPQQDLTKLDVAAYYQAVARRMLPLVVNRPLAIVRCPQGLAAKCFFQKHVKEGTPETIHAVDVGMDEGPHLYIKDLAGLIQLVQLGVLEVHVWGCTVKDIERPDQLTFDLDPSPEVAWTRVCDAAREMRDLLAGIGLNSFVKTTGGKGLHVVVPLKPSVDWDEAKAFTKLIAEQMSADQPAKYLANMSKAKRKGRIFIDYLRNGRGATAICAYSTRARPGAPVSMPLRWDELSKVKSGDAFTVENAPARVRSQRQDPWHDFDRKRVDLGRIIERATSA